MNETTPIKRSEELQPLSREHHDGLLFVWKLRQGLKKGISNERLRDFGNWYWKHHIRGHFYQEEVLLLPFFPPDHPLVKQLKDDHNYISELLLSTDREPDRYNLELLCKVIERHIRFEEREFFQYLENTLDKEQLKKIHEGLEKHPVICNEEWRDPFWITEK
jgi:hemerythrin-like domain-containing protein